MPRILSIAVCSAMRSDPRSLQFIYYFFQMIHSEHSFRHLRWSFSRIADYIIIKVLKGHFPVNNISAYAAHCIIFFDPGFHIIEPDIRCIRQQ